MFDADYRRKRLAGNFEEFIEKLSTEEELGLDYSNPNNQGDKRRR